MKRIALFTIAAGAVCLAFTFRPAENKRIHVAFTVEEWQRKLILIESTKEVVRNSTLPINVASPLIDSLTLMNNAFAEQIRENMKIDSTSAGDSTVPKKKLKK